MTGNNVAVATITWARSASEETLLRRSLDRLARSGLHIAVADTGESATFLDYLKSAGTFSVTVPRPGGMIGQVKASFDLAARLGPDRILYTEPDKELFFSHGLEKFLQRASEHARAGVVLAARSDESYATFPPLQRYAESVINHLDATFFGTGGDYSYGPFVMHRALLETVAGLRTDLGWGWRHFVFAEAHRRGMQLVHVTGDHPCPPEQQREDDEDGRHRLRQLSQNILGLIG
jgi:hypothetical protein